MNAFNSSEPGFGLHADNRPTRGNWLTGRMVFGLLLLVLGLLWTLDNLNVLEADEITQWWPAVLLVWGLCQLTGTLCRRQPFSGGIWAFIGGWLLLRRFDLVPFDLLDLWPLALILLGAMLVVRAWRGRPAGAIVGVSDEPAIHLFACMGYARRRVRGPNFTGGDINVLLGGALADLRGTELAGGRATLDLFALWGGIEVIVPEGWHVITEVTPVMGGIEDQTVQAAEPLAPTLFIRGTAVMGGIEIKHRTSAETAGARTARRREGREGT